MRLLVTGALGPSAALLDEVRALGHEVTFMQGERAALPPAASKAEGVICNSLFLHHDLSNFPELRFVQLTSAGQDRIDSAELERRGISLHTAVGVYGVPLAEWVVLQILQVAKRSRHFARAQENKQWAKERGLVELQGRTACIVGFGEVGEQVALRLRAFGMKIVAVRRQRQHSPLADEVVPLAALTEALSAADVVVLALPLTPDTHHLFDETAIASMRPDAILVNVSRGALVDEQALVKALDAGLLFGAALDVFEREPLDADNPLWEIERVIVTPHNAYASDQIRDRLHTLVLENLRKLAEEPCR